MAFTASPTMLALAAIAVLNICFSVWDIGLVAFAPSTENVLEDKYTYLGDDYPLIYPMGSLDTVAMTLQETVRFELNQTDPVAEAEWLHLSSIPKGFGRMRLGPEYRMFVITVYHQMHCMRKIQVGLLNRSDTVSTYHHVRHCLNYLRQTFLCGAADMLETGDFMRKNYEVDRVGDSLVCQDWEQVYDELDQNYERWLEWRKKWN